MRKMDNVMYNPADNASTMDVTVDTPVTVEYVNTPEVEMVDSMDIPVAEVIAPKKAKKVSKYNRYFKPLYKFITKDNTINIPKSEILSSEFVPKDGTDAKKKIGHYVFSTNFENLFNEGRKTLPKRLIVKLNGVRRIWMLDKANTKDEVIYKSMLNDLLIVKNL